MRAIMAPFVFCALLLSAGCATLGGNSVSLKQGNGKEEQVSIDPISFMGLEWSPALEQGNYVAVMVTFPEDLLKEYHPLRMRYPALAYDKHGRQYKAQALYIGYAQCELRLAFIIEGIDKKSFGEVYAVVANTLHDRLYSLYGDVVDADPLKLRSDPVYRAHSVVAGGNNLRSMQVIALDGDVGLNSVLSRWNTYRIPGHEYRTPLGKDLLKAVSRENAEYSFKEKLVANARVGITADWVSTAIGAVSDLFTASQAPSRGWDTASSLKREDQGLIAIGLRRQYQAAINAGMSCTKEQTRAAR